MIDDPKIVETESQMAAVIHLTMPRAKILGRIPPAIEELVKVIQEQGQTVAGPMFTHSLTCSTEQFDLQVGFLVDVPVSQSGRVKPGELLATRVARTVYHGGYEGLAGARSEFGRRMQKEWVRELAQEGLEAGLGFWNSYVAGPEAGDDPSGRGTELSMRLVDGT